MVEQIYKQLFKDEEGKYLFANEEDTRYVVEQQSYILIYILELLLKLSNQQAESNVFLSNEKSNEKKEKENGKTKCGIKNCEGKAMILYGGRWICGNCIVKIMNKEQERKNKQMEELEKELENASNM